MTAAKCSTLALALFSTLLVPGSAAPAATARPDLAKSVEPLFALDLAPGMAVSVVRGGELVYAAGFGVADVASGRAVTPETLFYVASTTKSFTGTAAALLDRRGVVALDAPIRRYLPTLRLQAPLSPDAITVRDLLTMTHGIANDGPVVFRTAFSGVHDPDLLLSLLARHPPAENGRAFDYGNLGYNVYSLIVDSRLEAGWKETLRRELFVPLGMHDTLATLDGVPAERLAAPHGTTPDGFRRLPMTKGAANMHAAGGHVTTVLDLARWLEAHLDKGRVDGAQVLPAEVVAETHRQQAEQDRKFGDYHRHGWGLGWDLGTYEGELLVHRFGSYAGYRSHLSFMPERGIGVAVLVNDSMLGSYLPDAVANAIYDRLLGKPDLEARESARLARLGQMATRGREGLREELAKRAARQQPLAHPRTIYVGAYENEELGRMEWRLEGDVLHVRIGLAESDAEIYDAATERFRVELTGGGEVVQFELEGERAARLTYAGRTFERVPR